MRNGEKSSIVQTTSQEETEEEEEKEEEEEEEMNDGWLIFWMTRQGRIRPSVMTKGVLDGVHVIRASLRGLEFKVVVPDLGKDQLVALDGVDHQRPRGSAGELHLNGGNRAVVTDDTPRSE